MVLLSAAPQLHPQFHVNALLCVMPADPHSAFLCETAQILRDLAPTAKETPPKKNKKNAVPGAPRRLASNQSAVASSVRSQRINEPLRGSSASLLLHKARLSVWPASLRAARAAAYATDPLSSEREGSAAVGLTIWTEPRVAPDAHIPPGPSTCKPQLLVQLEELVRKGAALLDPSAPEIYERRWEVYRNCLKAFIDATPTYGPLLSRVLEENDELLRQYRDLMRSPQEVCAKVDAIQRECKRTAETLHRRYQHELAMSAAEIVGLRQELAALKNSLAAKNATIETLTSEVEQARLPLKTLQESEAELSRLLLAKTAQCRLSENLVEQAKQGVVEARQEAKVRVESERRAVAEMQAKFEDFRILEEQLNERVQALETELAETKAQFERAKESRNKVRIAAAVEHMQLTKAKGEVQRLQTTCATLREQAQTRTPRPDWAALAPELRSLGQYGINGPTRDIVRSLVDALAAAERRAEATSHTPVLQRPPVSRPRRLSNSRQLATTPGTERRSHPVTPLVPSPRRAFE
eukprot:TRINITY_DN5140_c0_g1_i2.p1 TRINITY_DN5140_c0_g1~~TRINITY_DN5140_c0_g1_i2.p1  ORF type:complete len:525 (+),score=77.46 TRINITY_DN5140_c0_g1_i2:772-2346(+)